MLRYIKFFYSLIFLYSSLGNSVDNLELNNAVENFLLENNFNGKFNLNTKLKLPTCEKEIIINKKFNSLKTLEVRCPQKNSWTYNIRPKIQSNKLKSIKKSYKKNNLVRLVKVNNNIYKGYVFKEEDILYAKVRTPGSSNYFTNKDEIIGKKAKVSIRKGQIIRIRHLEKNWTIKEGQKVIIVNNKSNIEILVDGIALNSAMLGEYTNVLNKSSGMKLKAWVKNNKKVSIFR